MRQRQREVSFSDSTWKDSSTERSLGRQFETLGRVQSLDTGQYLMPMKRSMHLVCLECGKQFTSKSTLPECPQCGGSDIDLQ